MNSDNVNHKRLALVFDSLDAEGQRLMLGYAGILMEDYKRKTAIIFPFPQRDEGSISSAV